MRAFQGYLSKKKGRHFDRIWRIGQGEMDASVLAKADARTMRDLRSEI
jgi:hypothetical protein